MCHGLSLIRLIAFIAFMFTTLITYASSIIIITFTKTGGIIVTA